METKDQQLIAEHDGFCGTCKYFEASLCKPTESTNTWETWFWGENANCLRYPPVFVGSDLDIKTDEGDFDSLNWQHPKVDAFCRGCGEYVRASWVPNAALTRRP